MINKLDQTIKEEIVKLPKELRGVIETFGWELISEEIGKKYSLTKEQISSLKVEIFLIMSGIVEEDYFIINIENRVGVSKDESKNIATEIDQKIFTPILTKRDELIKKKLSTENPSWDQTVNFILSGGDYSCFIEEPIKPSVTIKPSTVKSNFSI